MIVSDELEFLSLVNRKSLHQYNLNGDGGDCFGLSFYTEPDQNIQYVLEHKRYFVSITAEWLSNKCRGQMAAAVHRSSWVSLMDAPDI